MYVNHIPFITSFFYLNFIIKTFPLWQPGEKMIQSRSNALSFCHVYGWLRRGFGLVIAFINNLQVVTTINYYTIAALHNVRVQSLHTNLFSLSALVFTGL
jgi:hypothetical protein